LLPVLVWAALAFEVRGAATILAIISAIATWATNAGLGPFAGLAQAPIPLVQQFIAVTALTTLLLATITDERRAREATRQREERLRAAIEASGAGTFRWRFEQDDLDCDAALLALFDVTPAQAPRCLEDLVGIIHPEDRALALAAFDGCVRRGSDFSLTARINRAGGTIRIIQGRGRRVDDPDGLPDYITGAFVDVTERSRLERRLLKAEETYRAVFEQAGVGVARLALNGQILEANDRFCEIAGRPLRDLLGSNWAGLDEAQAPASQAAGARLDNSRIEKRYDRPGQGPVWVDESLTLVRDEAGIPAFFVAIVQDVTERTLAEEEVRLRAEELEVVLREVPAAIWFAHDSACSEVTGNSFSKEILRLPDVTTNMSKTAPDPETVAHFKVYDSAGMELAARDLPVQRAARGDIVRNFEERVTFVDGSSIHLLGNASPLLDSNGNIRGAVAAFIDITDRKRAEAREQLLSREVDHRAKNVLAIVQAIVQLTQADNMAAFRRMVAGRIHSLARTHTLLAESRWEGVDLYRLVTDELAPIALTEAGQIDADHFLVDGPPVWLQPSAAQAFALIIHELVTNAVKYGGLSVPEGHVSVGWTLGAAGGAPTLHFRWSESGGPPPRKGPPVEKGFGWTVIRTSVEDQLGGSLTANWITPGLDLLIDVPMHSLNPSAVN
jgi:PAS domain S-box-containing protein